MRRALGDKIAGAHNDNWNRAGCLPGCAYADVPHCDNDIDRKAGQFGGERGERIQLSLRKAVVDQNVLTFDVAQFLQAATKRSYVQREWREGTGPEKADTRNFSRLFARALAATQPQRYRQDREIPAASCHALRVRRRHRSGSSECFDRPDAYFANAI